MNALLGAAHRRNAGGGGGLQAETIAWEAAVAAASGTLTGSSESIANGLMVALNAKSYRSKIKYLLPFLGANLAAGLTPLIDGLSAGRPTNTNFVDGNFTESGGLQGAATKVLTLPFKASGLGTSNSGGIAIWVFGVDAGSSLFGCFYDNSGSPANAYVMYNSSTNVLFRWGANGGTTDATATSVSSTEKFVHCIRSSATSRRIIVDGTLKVTNTVSDPTGNPSGNFFRLMGDYYNGAARPNTARVAVFVADDGTISDTDAADLYATLNTYLMGVR